MEGQNSFVYSDENEGINNEEINNKMFVPVHSYTFIITSRRVQYFMNS